MQSHPPGFLVDGNDTLMSDGSSTRLYLTFLYWSYNTQIIISSESTFKPDTNTIMTYGFDLTNTRKVIII